MWWSIHYILNELISKANELLCFEVLVQKLLPGVGITQCMQEREIVSWVINPRIKYFPYTHDTCVTRKATGYMEK